MSDTNKPANTSSPSVTKRNAPEDDHAAARPATRGQPTLASETPLPRGEPARDVGLGARAGETTASISNREGAVTAREEAVTRREGAAGLRENAVRLREERSTVREATVRAREEAVQAQAEQDQLMAQMREANERLVLGTVRAQTLTEDAEQANRLKDEFLATVSHELRTPLNAILGWARMLGSQQLAPDRASHAVTIIERNAAALAHIIEDLLDVSRIVAGTLDLTPQPVDLNAVAQASIDAVRPLAGAKHVQLEFSPTLTATVDGDSTRLQQVIWNLLSNAIKFTPEGGRVALFIQPAEDHMEVRVVDTGQGIDSEFLPHVFERFRQADGATTRRHTGLGLGLAIVRQLVELHGGTVHAASDGVDRGATFTVRLPIAREPQGKTPAPPPERRIAAATASPTPRLRRIAAATASPAPRLPRLDEIRILVVDDSLDGRAMTSLLLTEAGASVNAAESVREALQILERERPDVLVTDIGLPDQDGYALIRQIRQDEAVRGGFLPAIALTGYARADDRKRILAAGFQAHVPKPFEPVELASAIAAVTPRLRKADH
jgi:signal transduction histidine kinase/ActR/RegA family two-component response regulator